MPRLDDPINLAAGQQYRDAWPVFVERMGDADAGRRARARRARAGRVRGAACTTSVARGAADDLPRRLPHRQPDVRRQRRRDRRGRGARLADQLPRSRDQRRRLPLVPVDDGGGASSRRGRPRARLVRRGRSKHRARPRRVPVRAGVGAVPPWRARHDRVPGHQRRRDGSRERARPRAGRGDGGPRPSLPASTSAAPSSSPERPDRA